MNMSISTNKREHRFSRIKGCSFIVNVAHTETLVFSFLLDEIGWFKNNRQIYLQYTILHIYVHIYIYVLYIILYIYIYMCVYIYISKNLQFSFSLVSLKHIWAKDTIITVFLICTEILLSAIILTSQARSAHTRPPGNISWYRLKVKLILYQYHFIIIIILELLILMQT